jgi:hypothetical protein
MVGIEAFIGDDILTRFARQERACLSDVVDLPRGDAQVDRIAEGVHDGVDFRRQAAA